MKRIYALRDNQRQHITADYFEKKMDAKAVRNKMNEDGSKVFVTKGPDHPHYTETLKPNMVKRKKRKK